MRRVPQWCLCVGLAAATAIELAASAGRAQSPVAPHIACGDLRALTTYEFSIDVASVVPAKDGIPESCHVEGLIIPEVRFVLSLPTAWNGRLYMYGNSEFAGEPFTTPGRIQRRDNALRQGFAVVATDTGHDAASEPGATFALNPQKFIDFAYRSVHVTALTAKTIVRAYYNHPADRSYFDGCSTGGRQGLTEAQRFPDDFDGIVIGAPSHVMMAHNAYRAGVARAFEAASISRSKLQLVGERIYSKCDAVDGLSDGIIDDPRQCAFDPAKDLPTCGNGEGDANCLTPADIRAFQTVYSDVVVNGTTIFPGLPKGSEIVVPTPNGPRSGWENELYREGAPSGFMGRLEGFFGYMVSPGTPLDWRTFDPGKDLEKLRTAGGLINAIDPDLKRFRARGGKIVMYFGWADPLVNPLTAVEYFDRVRQVMGASTDDFFRLFMMPGMFHCGGGVGPDRADWMTSLADWVERGKAPATIVATKVVGGKPVRARPLCPYPAVARYTGKGSIDEAASFVCRSP